MSLVACVLEDFVQSGNWSVQGLQFSTIARLDEVSQYASHQGHVVSKRRRERGGSFKIALHLKTCVLEDFVQSGNWSVQGLQFSTIARLDEVSQYASHQGHVVSKRRRERGGSFKIALHLKTCVLEDFVQSGNWSVQGLQFSTIARLDEVSQYASHQGHVVSKRRRERGGSFKIALHLKTCVLEDFVQSGNWSVQGLQFSTIARLDEVSQYASHQGHVVSKRRRERGGSFKIALHLKTCVLEDFVQSGNWSVQGLQFSTIARLDEVSQYASHQGHVVSKRRRERGGRFKITLHLKTCVLEDFVQSGNWSVQGLQFSTIARLDEVSQYASHQGHVVSKRRRERGGSFKIALHLKTCVLEDFVQSGNWSVQGLQFSTIARLDEVSQYASHQGHVVSKRRRERGGSFKIALHLKTCVLEDFVQSGNWSVQGLQFSTIARLDEVSQYASHQGHVVSKRRRERGGSFKIALHLKTCVLEDFVQSGNWSVQGLQFSTIARLDEVSQYASHQGHVVSKRRRERGGRFKITLHLKTCVLEDFVQSGNWSVQGLQFSTIARLDEVSQYASHQGHVVSKRRRERGGSFKIALHLKTCVLEDFVQSGNWSVQGLQFSTIARLDEVSQYASHQGHVVSKRRRERGGSFKIALHLKTCVLEDFVQSGNWSVQGLQFSTIARLDEVSQYASHQGHVVSKRRRERGGRFKITLHLKTCVLEDFVQSGNWSVQGLQFSTIARLDEVSQYASHQGHVVSKRRRERGGSFKIALHLKTCVLEDFVQSGNWSVQGLQFSTIARLDEVSQYASHQGHVVSKRRRERGGSFKIALHLKTCVLEDFVQSGNWSVQGLQFSTIARLDEVSQYASHQGHVVSKRRRERGGRFKITLHLKTCVLEDFVQSGNWSVQGLQFSTIARLDEVSQYASHQGHVVSKRRRERGGRFKITLHLKTCVLEDFVQSGNWSVQGLQFSTNARLDEVSQYASHQGHVVSKRRRERGGRFKITLHLKTCVLEDFVQSGNWSVQGLQFSTNARLDEVSQYASHQGHVVSKRRRERGGSFKIALHLKTCVLEDFVQSGNWSVQGLQFSTIARLDEVSQYASHQGHVVSKRRRERGGRFKIALHLKTCVLEDFVQSGNWSVQGLQFSTIARLDEVSQYASHQGHVVTKRTRERGGR